MLFTPPEHRHTEIGMALKIKHLPLALFALACHVIATCNAAAEDSAWATKYSRAVAASTCPKKCRSEIQLCIEKVAKTEEEQEGCGRIFVNCYPACFYSEEEEKALVNGNKCITYCWTKYGACTASSNSVGEQFTCFNFRLKCSKGCEKNGKKKRSTDLLRRAVQQLLSEKANDRDGEAQEKKRENAADLLALFTMWQRATQKQERSINTKSDLGSQWKRGYELVESANQLSEGSNDVSFGHKEERQLSSSPSSCENDCQGYYDACRTQVNSISDHITCVEAKKQCREWC